MLHKMLTAKERASSGPCEQFQPLNPTSTIALTRLLDVLPTRPIHSPVVAQQQQDAMLLHVLQAGSSQL